MLFISLLSFSQIKFEKAYFITNSNDRIECFIKNIDWRNNPNSFEYKINEHDNSKQNNIKNVKLFEIYNQVKYVRGNVKFDNSSNSINNLSNVRDPEFIEKEIFLKKLTAGSIRLYKFTEGNITRFFYETGDNNFEQLIYKPYEIESNKIAYNDDYKKQLESKLNCTSINHQEIQKLQYKEKELTDLFIKYYKCSDPNYKEKLTKTNKGKFNLYIRPRINSSSSQFQSSNTNTNSTTPNKMSFGCGVETEYILPYNKNKWSVVVEPTYQHYTSEGTIDANYLVGGKLTTIINYKSIELPIGLRHYMYLNDKSKLFINAQYIIDLVMKSNIEFKRNDNTIVNSLDVISRPNIAIGLGYNYNNKYGIEARFFSNRNITSDYLNWQSKFKSFSLILSYNIF